MIKLPKLAIAKSCDRFGRTAIIVWQPLTGCNVHFYDELERIDRSKLFEIQTSVSGVPFAIEDSKKIILFGILQEAMNNIVKHSEATNIDVNITHAGDELNIIITDNGNGKEHDKNLTASNGAV